MSQTMEMQAEVEEEQLPPKQSQKKRKSKFNFVGWLFDHCSKDDDDNEKL